MMAPSILASSDSRWGLNSASSRKPPEQMESTAGSSPTTTRAPRLACSTRSRPSRNGRPGAAMASASLSAVCWRVLTGEWYPGTVGALETRAPTVRCRSPGRCPPLGRPGRSPTVLVRSDIHGDVPEGVRVPVPPEAGTLPVPGALRPRPGASRRSPRGRPRAPRPPVPPSHRQVPHRPAVTWHVRGRGRPPRRTGRAPRPRSPPGSAPCRPVRPESAGHHRPPESEAGRLLEPLAHIVDLPDLTTQSHLAQRHQVGRERATGGGRRHRQGHRQVGGGLGDPHPAGHRGEHVEPGKARPSTAPARPGS